MSENWLKSHTESGQIALLSQMAELANSGRNVSFTLNEALALMASHLGILRGVVTLVSPANGKIRIEAAWGLNPEEQARGHYSRGEGVTGRVIETGEAMGICNASSEPLFLNRTESRNLASDDISFLCVPIKLGGQVVGALSVDYPVLDATTLQHELQLLTIIASILGHTAMEKQLGMDHGLSTPLRPAGFIGNSPSMERVYEQIGLVADSCANVLVLGESGTGKELVARAIHAASRRSDKAFVTCNCAALPEQLIESELFGHERGAFTGAQQMRKGRFELADGGTLFLDEIGEMPLSVQPKLLRVLQTHSFERVGGMETRHVDVRCVAATNRDLTKMVEEGSFRRDLFYRLNVFPIQLPPLHERREDILPLCSHFLQHFGSNNGNKNIRLSLASMDILEQYSWPGNVRELENVMERSVLLLGQDRLVLPRHLPGNIQNGKSHQDNATAPLQETIHLQDRLDELERAYILEALEASGGQVGRAAARLGLTERVMALRMKKYAITYKEFRHKTT